MRCKYLKLIKNQSNGKVCTNRNNLDIRSKKHGKYKRRYPRRCSKEYCPLNFKEIQKQKDL